MSGVGRPSGSGQTNWDDGNTEYEDKGMCETMKENDTWKLLLDVYNKPWKILVCGILFALS
jgi:hypothetical protein